MWVNKIIEGDCLDVMEKFPNRCIDMILCDLPYGKTRNPWDQCIDFTSLWRQYIRIIRESGVIALTSQGVFTAELILSNLRWYKYKYVWIKSKATNYLNSKKQPLRKHEDVCIFYNAQPDYFPEMSRGVPYNKGMRKKQLTGCYNEFAPSLVKNSDGKRYPTDVLYFKTAETEGAAFHPNQKPVALGQYLIRTYTLPGDIVLDNACGSGSFLVAAIKENRRFIGIEKNEKAYQYKTMPVDFVEIAQQRIQEAQIEMQSLLIK